MQQTRRGFLGVALAAGFAAIAGRIQTPASEDLVLAMDKAAGPDMTGIVHYTDGTITHVQYGRGQTRALYHTDEGPFQKAVKPDVDLASGTDTTVMAWYTDGNEAHWYTEIRTAESVHFLIAGEEVERPEVLLFTHASGRDEIRKNSPDGWFSLDRHPTVYRSSAA